MIGNPSVVENNLAGAFMLFRGVKLLPEHLMKWEFAIGDCYNMPGNSSCSESLQVALQFALNNPRPDYDAVLFIITCQNYETF